MYTYTFNTHIFKIIMIRIVARPDVQCDTKSFVSLKKNEKS